MKPIEVFYHVYIPPDIRSTMWTWWTDQQLGLLKSSKLSNFAKVNMVVTMPKHWLEIYGIPFRKDQHKDQFITFEEKLREYISFRYPFVNILDVRDTGEPNVYEGQTLKLIHDRCQQTDANILYFHSKGTVSSSPQVASWREILNYYCINEWLLAVNALNRNSVAGIKDACTGDRIFSGNFWWATAEHIRTLPNPIDTHLYNDNRLLHPYGPTYRYGFEHWIRVGDPKTYYLIDTKTDHFDDYCFLENLLKEQNDYWISRINR